MKRIVIVGYCPLTQKTNVVLGVDKLVKHTLVEYWDVSPIVGNQGFPVKCHVSKVKVTEMARISEFESAVKNLDSNTLVIFNMLVKYDTCIFFRYLVRTPCKIAAVVVGSLPVYSNENETKIESLKQLVNRIHTFFNITHFSLAIRNRLALCWIRHLRPFDYYLYSGAKANYSGANYNPRTMKIPINSYDCQLAKSFNESKISTEKFIVFIDDYLAYHPDFLMLGIETVNPDVYYNELNAYFDRIEERYGLPVVIAAHPRADRYKEANYFNGRRVLFGSTMDLTARAEFVITHFSTAISYAIINMKPILFIYTDEMISKNLGHGTFFSMADLLNSNIVNISQSVNTDVFPVNEERYKDYLYSYETSPEVVDKDNYEVILELLKID